MIFLFRTYSLCTGFFLSDITEAFSTTKLYHRNMTRHSYKDLVKSCTEGYKRKKTYLTNNYSL